VLLLKQNRTWSPTEATGEIGPAAKPLAVNEIVTSCALALAVVANHPRSR
jgi:hypothetical protein